MVIPQAIRPAVLKMLHASHLGMTAMKEYARSYVWWPKMDAAIENAVRGCHQCQMNCNDPPSNPPRNMEKPSNPWSTLHLDFVGPSKGKTFLITLDTTSKWLDAQITSSMASGEEIRCLRSLFATHEIPRTRSSRTMAQHSFPKKSEIFLKRTGSRIVHCST